MEELRIGLIGLGGFAQVIAKALAGAPGVRLVAAAEVDPKRRAQAAAVLPGIGLYGEAGELLGDKDVDLVIVATPPYLHAELGERVLAAGKHLYLEKPGALTPEAMARLRRKVYAAGLKASIDYVMRRNPLYFLLRELEKEGLFGAPERAYLENYAHDDHMPPEHWFWDYTRSGGIWVEHGVHFLDVAHWLFGPVDWVWAAGLERPGEGIVERVLGTALHKNGCAVSYYHGFTKPEPFEDTTFTLVWERAYATLHGWIPVRLTLDALITPAVQAYLTDELLTRARLYLPGIGVELERGPEEHAFPGGSLLRGRGKEYRATARLRLTYTLAADRWTVYRACIRQGVLDLAAAVRAPEREPEVKLEDAEAALKVSAALTESAACRQPQKVE